MAFSNNGFTMSSVFMNSFEGINEMQDHTCIRYNEASYARNCDTRGGILSTAKTSDIYINKTFEKPIGTLVRYIKNNIEYLLVATGNKLLEVDTKGNTKVIYDKLTSDKLDYVNVNYNSEDMLVICNGVDETLLYDGHTIRPLRNRGYLTSIDVEGETKVNIIDTNGKSISEKEAENTRSPKGKFVELHFERLWMAGDLEHPDRLYFSTANVNGFDIEDWTFPLEEGEANQHGGIIEIPSYDGGKIIGLKTIFNDVVIFKTHNMFRIFGTYPGNYEVEQLFSCNGGISDRSIVATNNKVYFANADGIYIFDGTNVTKISDKIKESWKMFSEEELKNSTGAYRDGIYILSIPKDGKSYIVEFDETANTFMICEDKATKSFVKYKEKLLFENNNQIYVYKESTKGVKEAIWKSGLYDMGCQDARKRSEYIYFIGIGNGKVKITATTDRRSKSIIVNLDKQERVYRKKLKSKGRAFQLTIKNVDGSSFIIKKPKVTIELDVD